MSDPDQRFPREQVDAFFAAVQINDVVDEKLIAPAGIPTWQPQERLADYHALCRQLWIEDLDRRCLRTVTMAGIAGRSPDPETLTRFKHVRAKFKQLRYASSLRRPGLVRAASISSSRRRAAHAGSG